MNAKKKIGSQRLTLTDRKKFLQIALVQTLVGDAVLAHMREQGLTPSPATEHYFQAVAETAHQNLEECIKLVDFKWGSLDHGAPYHVTWRG